MTVLDSLAPAQAALVRSLGETFARAGEELSLVGGVVRDLLIDQPDDSAASRTPNAPDDLDFATSARPDRTQALVEGLGIGSVYTIGEKFGTIGVAIAPEAVAGLVDAPDGAPALTVEITTYRAEHYPDDTRHPEVAFGTSLLDDLGRRDFTVNAIAADAVTGELTDPFDGTKDLYQSRLRAVGDPDARFLDDPLRLLRAARFVSQLGFSIAGETADAMARQAPELGRISRERVYAELTRLLTGRWASHGLYALLETGLLVEAAPELEPMAVEATITRSVHREKDLWDHTVRVVDATPRRATVRWAALLHDAAKPHTRSIDATGEVHFFGHERVGADLAGSLLRRLGAEKATVAAVARLVELHLRPASYDPSWTDSAVRRLSLEAGGVLEDLLDLASADITSANARKRQVARERMAALRAHIARLEAELAMADLKSPLDGDQLMALFDRPPGRWIAEVKDHLRELVIDGELGPHDVARAEVIARQLLGEP